MPGLALVIVLQAEVRTVQLRGPLLVPMLLLKLHFIVVFECARGDRRMHLGPRRVSLATIVVHREADDVLFVCRLFLFFVVGRRHTGHGINPRRKHLLSVVLARVSVKVAVFFQILIKIERENVRNERVQLRLGAAHECV